jgi:hypothetical protein
MTTTSTDKPITASGTFQAGPLSFHRLGFGAMRITGPGIWGPPADHDEAIAVLRRAVELGVDFIDTASRRTPMTWSLRPSAGTAGPGPTSGSRSAAPSSSVKAPR